MTVELEATIGKWFYVCCFVMVKIGTSGVTIGRECAACLNTNLRFTHVLEHKEDGRQIEVGIDCARLLLDSSDAEIPRLAENETRRKEGWRIYYRKPGRCVTTVEDLDERGKL